MSLADFIRQNIAHCVEQARYLHVRAGGTELNIQGTMHADFGHLIPDSGSGTDGIYAGWKIERDTVHVAGDRYGIYPLFYYCSKSEFIISNSIARVLSLAPTRELDFSALSVFLHLGFYLGEDSAFEGIKTLPPGARLNWSRERFTLNTEFPQHQARATKPSTAADDYLSLFRAAMERRLPTDESFAFPLSGGLDSRHILFELMRLNRPPAICVTGHRFGAGNGEDQRVAPALANAFGLQHRFVPLHSRQAKAEIEAAIQQHLCADEGAWFLPCCAFLQSNCQFTYDGIGGDILSASLYASPKLVDLFRRENYQALTDELLRTWKRESVTSSLCASETQSRLDTPVARHRLSIELKKHVAAPNPIASFYFWNRTRREIALAPYALVSGRTTVYSPYLDRQLFDFLMSLPAEEFCSHNLHRLALARGYPQHSMLPVENKSIRPRRNWPWLRQALVYTNDIRRLLNSRAANSQRVLKTNPFRQIARHFPLAKASRLGFFSIYLMIIEHFLEKNSFSCSDD